MHSWALFCPLRVDPSLPGINARPPAGPGWPAAPRAWKPVCRPAVGQMVRSGVEPVMLKTSSTRRAGMLRLLCIGSLLLGSLCAQATLGEVKKGDLINLDFVPGQGLLFSRNGKLLGAAIPGEDLYGALLRCFIGEHPVDDKLKAGLLGSPT
ncbi:MAG: chalcone isomerase family protein [Burkholderiales bacterium]|nr:chalcone isomerase family protein [Burkholderiales bacterium]